MMNRKFFAMSMLVLCIGCGGEERSASVSADMSVALDEGMSRDMGSAGEDASMALDQGDARDECEQLVQCLLGCEDEAFACSATCSVGLSAEPSASAANLSVCLDDSGCQDEACAQGSCGAELMACRGERPEEEDMSARDMSLADMSSSSEDMPREMGMGGMMLPEAGYAACEGKMRMESCMWTSRMGEIMGRCVRIPQSQDPRQFCAPEDRLGGRDMGTSEDMGTMFDM